MPGRSLAERFIRFLEPADVRLDGRRRWDIRVIDNRLYRRISRQGPAAFGDAYVDGWWECNAIDELFDRIFRARLIEQFRNHPAVIAQHLREKLFNLQTRPRAKRNGQAHYNLGNDLFTAMLDKRMAYSCAFWKNARTLNDAQEAKLELICQKLTFEPGMRVLDIGSGWGSFVQYAAENYGCDILGITVSEEQAELSRRRCAGLPVEIRLQDYRDVDGQFDRVVSVGMFEHVGAKNYDTFMRVVRDRLAPDGLALLHFFATQRTWPSRDDAEVIWVQRHIFPGLLVPSLGLVGSAIDDRFVVEDLHNFGADYDKTLLAWFDNFDTAWPDLKDQYDERFYRMWKFYLLLCAAAFRSRKYQLWQFVLSPSGVRGGYAPLAQPSAHAHPPQIETTLTTAVARTRNQI